MIESVVFGGGKGFGESILLKLGENRYGIIDSFVDSNTGNPCALDYLRSKKINPDDVVFILLTHYHQDHYTGISDLLAECKQANFFTSNSIISETFQFLVSAYCRIESKYNFFNEFENIVKILRNTGRSIHPLSSDSCPILDEKDIQVFSLSPSKEAFGFLEEKYKLRAIKILESPGINLPISADFNFQSVVIIAQTQNHRFLFGSDLEYSNQRPEIGWSSVCKSKQFSSRKFDLFKIPHHGSQNGYNEADWHAFMSEKANLNMTPYSRGKTKLPQDEMLEKFKKLTPNNFITSELRLSGPPPKIKKKFPELKIRLLKNDVGSISTQTFTSSENIVVELGGGAICLSGAL